MVCLWGQGLSMQEYATLLLMKVLLVLMLLLRKRLRQSLEHLAWVIFLQYLLMNMSLFGTLMATSSLLGLPLDDLILAIIASGSLPWHLRLRLLMALIMMVLGATTALVLIVAIKESKDGFLILEHLSLQIAHRFMVCHELLGRDSIDIDLVTINQVK